MRNAERHCRQRAKYGHRLQPRRLCSGLMVRKVLEGLERAVPTFERLQRECLEVTAMVVPLWVLIHLPATTNALSPMVQALVDCGHWVVAWLLVPLCVVITVVSGALAVMDRDMRGLLPYAVLMLLDVVMARDVLAWLS